jgi:two-component system, NarL family, invasion response regulator UvrY
MPTNLLFFNMLSPREKEVASLIISGATTNEIAKKLVLKPNTVSTFKKKIFAKFQVESDVDLYKVLKEN